MVQFCSSVYKVVSQGFVKVNFRVLLWPDNAWHALPMHCRCMTLCHICHTWSAFLWLCSTWRTWRGLGATLHRLHLGGGRLYVGAHLETHQRGQERATRITPAFWDCGGLCMSLTGVVTVLWTLRIRMWQFHMKRSETNSFLWGADFERKWRKCADGKAEAEKCYAQFCQYKINPRSQSRHCAFSL